MSWAWVLLVCLLMLVLVEHGTDAWFAGVSPSSTHTPDMVDFMESNDPMAQQFLMGMRRGGGSRIVSVRQSELTFQSSLEQAIAAADPANVGPALPTPVVTKQWNVAKGEVTTVVTTGSKLQKKKHQIGTLASQAIAQSAQLMALKGASSANKKASAARYGW